MVGQTETRMSRDGAIGRIAEYFESDGFFDDLARRVAIHTESQEPDQHPELTRYLTEEMTPYLEPLGFSCEIFENPVPGCGPAVPASFAWGRALLVLMLGLAAALRFRAGAGGGR